MQGVAQLLATLRTARGLTIEDAAGGADMPAARLRRLERGTSTLGYLEGIRLAKALDLCPNCFRRFLEAAAERDELAASLSGERAPTHRSRDG